MIGMAIATLTAMAQDNPYVVKTKNVKKSMTAASDHNYVDDAEPKDFLGKNFRYYSMCDWNEGMRFMVIPEKYDLLVNTFHDASTHDVISNATLHHHIMIYKGYEELSDGLVHINFYCETDGKNYYYEIPFGTYDDYCYGKYGVPTLAYLGDVDKARELLTDQYLLTRTRLFREDTEYDGDGYREVIIPKNKVVKVVAIGVGTRSFPVKIIVEDENGRQFYQNVAMSKTNCGMRDNEFDMENAKFLFGGSFEFTGAEMAVSKNIYEYLNQTVHTKYPTEMSTRGAGKARNVKVPRFTGFIIDEIKSLKTPDYYSLTLRETEARRIYYKEVTFSDAVAQKNGNKEDYFGYLFGLGEGEMRTTTKETRAAIREGRVIPGMTEDEVELAVGEPVTTLKDENGVVEWLYNRSNGVLLVVQFDDEGIVTKASGRSGKPSASGAGTNSRRTASMSNTSQSLTGSGTMRQK